MKELSKVMMNLPQSGIRKLQDAARDIPDAIRLETGEPNFRTPDYICEGAAQAMRDGFTKYTAVPGIKTLRDAIAEDTSRRLGIDVDAKQIVVTGGGTMALQLSLACLCNPGDEVLVPDPSWPVYTMQVLSNHLKAVPYVIPASNGFQPRREDVEPLAERLLGLGAHAVLLKCGAAGIFLATSPFGKMAGLGEQFADPAWGDLRLFADSYRPDRIASGTGAGDTAIAAFLYSIMHHMKPAVCLENAAATGAMNLTEYDSLSGLLPIEALRRRIDGGWERQHLIRP